MFLKPDVIHSLSFWVTCILSNVLSRYRNDPWNTHCKGSKKS